jgi:hypothetical protein
VILGKVLEKLPRIRSRWPTDAKLTKDVQFNLFEGDRVIGVIGLKTGTKVKIVEIKSEHAVIQFGATQSPMPVTNTDIIDQLGGLEKILALPDDPAPPLEKTAPEKDAPKPTGKG